MWSAKAAVVVLSLACFSGHAQNEKPGAPAPISWSGMIWRALTMGGRNIAHAVLLVDVRLDSLDIPATMQLDTGANQDLLYTRTYNSLKPKDTPGDQYWIGLAGAVAGRAFKGDWFARADQGGAVEAGQTPLVGTIGAAFFERRVLLLDFVAQRVAILGKGDNLPAELERKIEFVPLEYRNGKMFVAVRLNGVEERELFFDTGSSAMPVITTRQRWLELTGRQPEDPRNTELVGESWGKPSRWLGAPLKDDMSIGGVGMSRPLVYFGTSGLANMDFEHYPFKTSGLFGNAPFDGRCTVVVDLPHKRFGIFEGSLANAN